MFSAQTLIEKAKRFYDRQAFRPLFYTIHMSAGEQSELKKWLQQARIYLEYGSGGSTLYALAETKARVYCVECHPSWYKHLFRYRIIRRALGKRLYFSYCDIGPVKKWGRPINDEQRASYPQYAQAILKSAEAPIDLVLIDGRFRIACLLECILSDKTNENTRIIFHDFWDRPHYHVVLPFVQIESSIDTMAIMRKPAGLNHNEVAALHQQYLYDPE